MNVRKKNEIISVGLDHIPASGVHWRGNRTGSVQAHAGQGTPVHVLNALNDYELRVGTFENAIDLDIRTFRAFPRQFKPYQHP